MLCQTIFVKLKPANKNYFYVKNNFVSCLLKIFLFYIFYVKNNFYSILNKIDFDQATTLSSYLNR